MKMQPLTPDIRGCTACGHDHDRVEIRPLRSPVLNDARESCSRSYVCKKFPYPIVLIPDPKPHLRLVAQQEGTHEAVA